LKILITGTTASQYSVKSNSKIPTFAGLLFNFLTQQGHSVIWQAPTTKLSKEWLDQFDKIIVGISSPSSVSSNRFFGAFSVISYARSLDKLVLFVDAPEPFKLWAGIRAFSKKPEEILKPFYLGRYEYTEVQNDPEVFTRISQSVNYLYTQQWPLTLYPSSPLVWESTLSKNIPNLSLINSHGLCFDSFILEDISREKLSGNDYWVVDQPNTNWTKNVKNTILKQVIPIKNHKWEDMSTILPKIDGAIGVLISSYKNYESWWSVLVPHALLLEVPVVTEWRNTIHLGKEWSMLPAQVEEMSPTERLKLARSQKYIYSSLLTSEDRLKESLEKTLLNTRYLEN
jgi:hypothetical protein